MYDKITDVTVIDVGEVWDPDVIQYKIGEEIRKTLKTNQDIEFKNYKEKRNKIKFTCVDEDWVYSGSVEIILGKGEIRKTVRYARNMSKKERRELVEYLYNKKGKTQKQIARLLDVSQPKISRILNE